MKVEVQITSTQKFGDNKASETNKCKGNIEKHEKGEILEFIEKYENQEMKFKMTILEDKIITLRNEETMIFDTKQITNTQINTPYGVIDMSIITKKIEVERKNNTINKIYLEYTLEQKDNIKYDNIVDIYIK